MANNNLALLKKYRANVFELSVIEQELHDSTVHDSVQSSAKFPYSKHSVPVDGVPPSEDAYRKQIRAQELRRDIRAVEWIVKLLPFRLREAVRIYYMDKHYERVTWEDVADIIDDGSTGEALKKSIQRELKKI